MLHPNPQPNRYPNPFAGQPSQHVLVTGGTGFIGTALVNQLVEAGHQVVVLTRDPQRAQARWGERVRCIDDLAAFLARPGSSGPDAVVNLAGAPVVGWPWTKRRQKVLLASRAGTTRSVLKTLTQAARLPKVWVQASAIGFYGVRPPSERLTESSRPGVGFMSKLCQRWEESADPVNLVNRRLVTLRLGVVWGQGGALPPLLMPIRLGFGGRIGGGSQMVSWIHLQDVLRLVARCLADTSMTGVYNAVAPEPISQAQFVQTAAAVLRRPNWFPLPAAPMRWVMGEMAEIFVDGQQVVPQRLITQGFTFDFPTAQSALRDLTR